MITENLAYIALALLILSAGAAFAFRKKRPLFFVSAGIAVLLLGYVAYAAILWLNKPKPPLRLAKADIVGEYRIDTTFYPGYQARWQYKHFMFKITASDSIDFTEMGDMGFPRKHLQLPISYNPSNPMLWRIEGKFWHHVLNGQPILFRGPERFYYVFHSEDFGNMFFRRVG
jgi:hypothetical protein